MNRGKPSARHPGRQALWAALLSTAAAAAIDAAPGAAMVVPTLTQPASGEHHVGKVIWADLMTPDLDSAKSFYGSLFGWTFREVRGDPNYALALLDDVPVAGLFQKAFTPGQTQQPAWLAFWLCGTLMLHKREQGSRAVGCYPSRTTIRSAAARRFWPIPMAPSSRCWRLRGATRRITWPPQASGSGAPCS